MELDLLAVGAHPDDAELCCGGTLASAVKAGYKAGIIDLTEGELGTRGTAAIRRREAREAAKILGCTRENAHIPDGRIDTSLPNRLKLIRLLRKYRPKVLLIPHFAERHPDHVQAHHLCREAWFYSGLRKIETTLDGREQKPWRPHHYFNYLQWQEFEPTFAVDITHVYEQRLRAIKAHKSQMHDPDSKEPATILSQTDFFEMLEARARYFGYRIGARYAEPFYSVQLVGVKDLFGLAMFHG
jgi:bacillithiol biosynthesis deacetylase BshB1